MKTRMVNSLKPFKAMFVSVQGQRTLIDLTLTWVSLHVFQSIITTTFSYPESNMDWTNEWTHYRYKINVKSRY